MCNRIRLAIVSLGILIVPLLASAAGAAQGAVKW